MPETTTGGWTLDDKPVLTKEQEREYIRLINQGKYEEAQKYLESILHESDRSTD